MAMRWKFFVVLWIAGTANPLWAWQSDGLSGTKLQEQVNFAFALLNMQLPDSALTVATNAHMDARSSGNQTLEAKALVAIALASRDLGEMAKSYQSLDAAMQIRKKLGDKQGVASVYNNLANNYLNEARYDLAIANAQEAINIYEATEGRSNPALGQSYLSLSEIYDVYGEYGEALRYARMGYNIHAQNDDPDAIGESLYTMAGCFFNLQQYDSAYLYFDKARDFYGKNEENNATLADIYTNQAAILMQRAQAPDFPAAWQLLDKSEKLLRDHTDKADFFYNDLKKGYWHHHYAKDDVSALHFLNKAKEQDFQRQKAEDKNYLFDLLSDVYANLGRMDSAFHYKNLSYQIRDSIFNEGRRKDYIRLQTERLKKENSEKELRAQKQMSRNRTLFAGIVLLSVLVALLVWAYQARKRAFLVISKQREQLHQQEIDEFIKSSEVRYLSAHIEGRETEKDFLARELHDRLGSEMVTLTWRYDSIFERLEPAHPLREQVGAMNIQLKEIYEELRTISHQNGSSILEKIGLVPVLSELFDNLNASGKIKAELEVSGLAERLPFQYELNLLRIIQELISNVLKYAKATSLTVQLSQFHDSVNLIVEDDGIGFKTDDPSTNRGTGISSVEKRIAALNGFFQIEPRPGTGTTFIIDLQLPNDEAPAGTFSS